MKQNVLLMNVSPTVRFAIRNALNESEFDLCREALTETQSFHLYESIKPTAVVVDLTLSPHQRLKSLRHFHKQHPESRIAVIYNHISRLNGADVRRAGAKEMVAFPFSKPHFLAALRRMTSRSKVDIPAVDGDSGE
jgi:DNA-binding NarL/FixJ family response regulator